MFHNVYEGQLGRPWVSSVGSPTRKSADALEAATASRVMRRVGVVRLHRKGAA